MDELVGATLSYKLRCAHGNVRRFLANADEILARHHNQQAAQ